MASANSFWPSAVVMFCSAQVSAVIESHASALGAVHGASSGTVWAIWSIAGSVDRPELDHRHGVAGRGDRARCTGVRLPFSYHSSFPVE